MKITKGSGWTAVDRELTIVEAVEDKLYPNAYSYEDQISKLQCHVDLQSEMIVKLVTLISTKLAISAEEVEKLLGYGYTVEE